ncbi:phage holin family protein [Patescibacteria group bacterium]|nr:phage holin family protein [Patescibacteria group bacterium]
MKSLIRSFAINLAALQAAVMLLPGVTNTGGIQSLIGAILVLAIINLLIRPIISLLLLPINLLTLGAFRWLVNVIILFLLTLLVADLSVSAFTFEGFNYQGFTIPQLEISKFWTLVLASLTLSITNSFLFWLSTES